MKTTGSEEGSLRLEFGLLPPEVNSARMYTGPGSAPMLAAAAAWDEVGAELERFAATYSTIISELHERHWAGPSATSMATTVAPYAAWVSATAQQATLAATQARLAVTAYETAFAATVPPTVIAANRTLLATLVATNFFGQNTPSIAATEAAYAEMWAQDAAAMYTYSADASSAATLSRFEQPPLGANPVGPSTQTIAATLQLAGLASDGSAAADPAASPILAAFETFNTLSGPLVPAYQIPFAIFTAGIFVNGLTQSGVQAQTLPELAAPLGGAAPSVLAHVGRAGAVGALSTPPSWAADTPVIEVATNQHLGSRMLPPWVGESAPASRFGVPAMAQLNGAGARRGDRTVFRMRDRRYRIPRPAPGG